MNLFICWSGERSHSLANIVADHFPRIIKGLTPFVSDQIEKGSLWFDEVRAKLDQADAGLLCLTPENIDSPWIHYEAGALASTLGAPLAQGGDAGRRRRTIYTYLLGVEPSSLRSPLSAYESTVADRTDTRQLVESIADAPVEENYENWWTDVQAAIDGIPPLPLDHVVPGFEALFRRKTFDERLVDCTHQRWVDRYEGARDTARELDVHRQRVRFACRKYVDDLYAELCGEVDAYAMDIRAFLIEEKHFPADEEGRIAIEPPGAAKACERRRQGIKTRVSKLLDARLAPVFEEACRFDMLETFAEKKNVIHRETDQIERKLKAGTQPLEEDELSRAAVSDWDFDRIAFYLVDERRRSRSSDGEYDVRVAVERVRMELEKVRAVDRVSDMPLHYSLGPLKNAVEEVDALTRKKVANVLDDVEQEIKGRDSDGQMRMTIAELRRKFPHEPHAGHVGDSTEGQSI